MADILPFPLARRAAPAATAEQLKASDPTVCAWVAASAGIRQDQVLTDRVLRLLLAARARPESSASPSPAPRRRRWRTASPSGCATGRSAMTTALIDGSRGADRRAAQPRRSLRSARRLFARVLDAPGGMRIETIHAFCQSLLRRFPLEAGCRAAFRPDRRSRRRRGCWPRRAKRCWSRRATVSRSRWRRRWRVVVSRMSDERGLVELIGRIPRRARPTRDAASAAWARRSPAPHDGGRARGVAATQRLELILAEACADHAFDAVLLRRAGQALLQGSARTIRSAARILLDWLKHAAERRAAASTPARSSISPRKARC